MNKYIKTFKENAIIVVPSVFVALVILGFIIFGFLQPRTKEIVEEINIVIYQDALEDAFMYEFSQENYTENNTFFVLNPYEMSPLSGLLMFEASEEKDYIIVVKGIEEDGDLEFQITSTFYENSNKFLVYAPIYGLYANRSNTVSIYEDVLGTRG